MKKKENATPHRAFRQRYSTNLIRCRSVGHFTHMYDQTANRLGLENKRRTASLSHFSSRLSFELLHMSCAVLPRHRLGWIARKLMLRFLWSGKFLVWHFVLIRPFRSFLEKLVYLEN